MKANRLILCAATVALSTINMPSRLQAAIPETEPLVIFDEYTNPDGDNFYKPSFTSATLPSIFLPQGTEEIKDGEAVVGYKNGRIALSTDEAYNGTATALKMTYHSQDGGAWTAGFGCHAPTHMAVFNIKKYKAIRMWVMSPTRMAKGVLPKLELQEKGNVKTKPLFLADHFTTDAIQPNTWTEIVIPISAIQTLQPTSNYRWDRIKLIFLSQTRKENTQRDFFIDNVTLVPDENFNADIVTDSDPDLIYRLSSFGDFTVPSTLEQAIGDGVPNKKLPISNDIKMGDAGNSIKISWKSMPKETGTGWKALLAFDQYSGYDATTDVTTLNFHVYSESGLTQATMPKVGLETHTPVADKPGNGPQVNMSDFIGDIPAGEWTKVTIPMSAFKAINGKAIFYKELKGFFLTQNADDEKQHTIYVDNAFLADEEIPTNTVPVVSDKVVITAHYAQGTLTLAGADAKVCSVYSLTGSLIEHVILQNNTARISLAQGAYILRTEVGTVKLMVN